MTNNSDKVFTVKLGLSEPVLAASGEDAAVLAADLILCEGMKHGLLTNAVFDVFEGEEEHEGFDPSNYVPLTADQELLAALEFATEKVAELRRVYSDNQNNVEHSILAWADDWNPSILTMIDDLKRSKAIC